MITSIEIENLRGIREGKLEGLAPLTVLTGPNASGKSTVLDALLIAANKDPADGIGRAVARHPKTPGGPRWLCRSDQTKARVEIGDDNGVSWDRRLESSRHCDEKLQEVLIRRGSPPPYSTVKIEKNGPPEHAVSGVVAFGGDNQYEARLERWFAKPPHEPGVWLCDPGIARTLHQTFSEVTRAGRRHLVHDFLADLIPGFERLEIDAVTEGDFGLAVIRDSRSVPVGLSGDGIQAFVQLALEIAAPPEGLVLVEEPEVYQHPRAIRQGAKALLANVRRGVQMVITTHSLELIDALLAEATEADLEGMALFNLALEDGVLRSGRRVGKEIAFARETLESDLR